jgi:hypothetical protein
MLQGSLEEFIATATLAGTEFVAGLWEALDLVAPN